jgi:large subunit ribosomal protein L18
MPNKTIKKRESKDRRHKHILMTVRGNQERPRLVVYRSNQHIYAQLVDDVKQQTLFGVSTLSKPIAAELKKAKSKVEKAKVIGKYVASIAKEKGVQKIVFDRGGYLYHGRVKALAEGAREGGLVF